jgi:peptidoglycan hydrolase CwlO-like protein
MVAAIGSSPVLNPTPVTGTSTGGLDAQLARYKQELSDCVNCASAKTASGKAEIAAIASKISAAEARIEKLAVAKPHSTPATQTTDTLSKQSGDAMTTPAVTYDKNGTAQGSSDPALTSRVSVYA